MSEHRLAEPVARVLNRGYRGQWAATCTCGHLDVGMSAGHAAEYHRRHLDNPESAQGAGDG